MSEKRHNWYHAVAKPGARLSNGRFYLVKKRDAFVGATGHTHPEGVIVWNSRHFITILEPGAAREMLELGRKADVAAQEGLDESYNFYLNY